MDAFTLGKLVIPTARLAVVLGVITTLILAAGLARRYQALENWAGGAVLSGFIAARAGYVLTHLEVYAQEPWTALYVWQGEFSLPWGLLGAAFYTGLRLRRQWHAHALALAAVLAGLAVWAGALQLAQTLAEPRPAQLAPLVLTDLQGQAVSLRTFEGRPMVLNLWASWCPPCRREMPVLEQAAREHPEVAFVFANQAETAPTVRAYLDRAGLALDNVLLDAEALLGAHFQARMLPTTLFFEADGRLRDVHLGEISRARLGDYLAALDRVERDRPDIHRLADE